MQTRALIRSFLHCVIFFLLAFVGIVLLILFLIWATGHPFLALSMAALGSFGFLWYLDYQSEKFDQGIEELKEEVANDLDE